VGYARNPQFNNYYFYFTIQGGKALLKGSDMIGNAPF
jgi:hypothetical protein